MLRNTTSTSTRNDLRRYRFPLCLGIEEGPNHERVREVFEEFDPERLPEFLITTNHVIFESITLARGSLHHHAAVEMGERLYDESLARIHWATPQDEREAFEYLKKYNDKEYSAVDCLSFVIMEQYGIREALAVDRDFTHQFIARPGPRE